MAIARTLRLSIAALIAWGAVTCACAASGLTTRPAVSGPDQPSFPRATVQLLVVSKGSFSAYLLPESHIGFPPEFGPYFRSVVLGAARRSRVLVYEDSNGDTWPGSPYWGGACLSERAELAMLTPMLVERVVANRQYSQWSDLYRSLRETGGVTADDQFSAFIEARGALINWIELEWRIQALKERDVAMHRSKQPKVTAQEYSIRYSARERIRKQVPALKTESIETYDDLAWAVCSLDRTSAKEGLINVIRFFDETEQRVQGRTQGSNFEHAGFGFAALRAQLNAADRATLQALSPMLGPSGRIDSKAVAVRLPDFGRGAALDKLWLGRRNERWADRIDEHAKAGRRGLFYVLGSLHLVDYEHFDGLLTMLERRGFTLQVVQGDGRPAPLDRRRAELASPASSRTCSKDPD